jgi:hypothetical protein
MGLALTEAMGMVRAQPKHGYGGIQNSSQQILQLNRIMRIMNDEIDGGVHGSNGALAKISVAGLKFITDG